MKNTKIEIISIAKYVYLIVFFTFLAGIFHPIITGSSFDNEISGVIVLFVGLAGAILVYKTANSEKRMIFMILGFALIAISFWYIIQLTGRVF